MHVKTIYQGITCLPIQKTFWNLTIYLLKEKDFFYEAVARQTNDIGDKRNYRHAYFTQKGQVIDVNRKMEISLIHIFQTIITDKQEHFQEEIQMAKQTLLERQIKTLSLELGELMKAHKDSECWTKAGELNHLLKSEEAQKLSPDFLEKLHQELRGYYYVNGEINKLHKQLYAKGSHLIEMASA